MMRYCLAARRLLGVACIALWGCVSHAVAQRGDAAAARGDWREAEAVYREAVEQEPDNVDLARKYSEAKSNAVATALRTAEACRVSNDAKCIERELGYVLRLDPSNVQAAQLRTQARVELALKALDEARLALESDNPSGVWRQLETVRSYGVPAGQEQEVIRLEQGSATKANDLARALLERARSQAAGDAVSTLAQARELAAGAAARNAQYAPTLAEIDQTRRRAVAEDVTAQVKVGEAALTREDYATAERAFDTAFRASEDTRFQSRASFARSMEAAKRAIEQRAFDVASGHLRTALATQEDRGRARALLEDVEPRVYRIRLESVTITQTRPGTSQPWVGKSRLRQATPVVAAVAVTYLAKSAAAGKAAHDVAAAVIDVPPENRPGLVTTIELPDGRLLKTQKVNGIYVIYGAEFFLYTNKLDNRTVRVSVVHERSGGNESVAFANVQLGQIVSGHIDAASVRGEAQALQQVVFSADPAEAWQDGMIGKAELQDQKENRASARSAPARAASRIRLLTANLVMPLDGSDADGSHPDPFFEIYQGRRQVFKSTAVQDTRSAGWSFTSTDLYLDPNEELIVKLIDADLRNDDQLATWTVAARELAAGQVRLTTPRETTFTLVSAVPADRPR